jgi:hypothetical protein
VIPIFVGLDARERLLFHVFCSSVARRTERAVAFTPLTAAFGGGRRDGSTDFAYARFMVPFLADFRGWAIYADGDMVCRADIAELWNMREERYAVMVAKHDYVTHAAKKMDGARNEHYPRKNWSSVMLFNCAHPANKTLMPAYIETADGAQLHRFRWLPDELIGDVPLEWNWLCGEYPHNGDAKLLHYTLGAPCFRGYEACDHGAEWREELDALRAPS